MRRVVVTGLGLLTPLGWGVEHNWKGILEGRSGIGPITNFDTEGYGCTIAGEIPSVDGRGGGAPAARSASGRQQPGAARLLTTCCLGLRNLGQGWPS